MVLGMHIRRFPLKLPAFLVFTFTLGAVGAAWSAGGVTASQFAVTESGSATVTVPVQVPRGIGGMEPQLSLSYTSGAGNGLLGLGWSLNGPSAVSRCPKTLAKDGVRGTVSFAVGDRYCLDGQRLEIVGQSDSDTTYGNAGTVYATERDSFSRITAVGSYQASQPTVPLSFKVETKAGLTMEYGLSAQSRVTTNFAAGTGTTTINRWLLQRIADRHGSFVEFFYCSGEVSPTEGTCTETEGTSAWNGSKVLHFVRYTNRAGVIDGTYAVMLRYQSRPDRVQVFHAGSASRQTQRISAIETYRGFAGPSVAQRGSMIRAYDITYEAIEDSAFQGIRATNVSRIVSIQERDSAGNTLPPLQFTVAPDAVFGMAVSHRPAVLTPAAPRPPHPCGGVIGNRTSMQCP